MAQFLSQPNPFQHSPDPATLSQASFTDNTMTSTSGLSMSKPKRGAKAFALALLPLALALTACGGGSSDSGDPPKTCPDGQALNTATDQCVNIGGDGGDGGSGSGDTSMDYGNYKEQFTALKNMSDTGVDIYKVINDGWNLLDFMNVKALMDLKKAHSETVGLTSKDPLTTAQRKEYETLIKSVRDLAQSGYTSILKTELKDLYNQAYSTTNVNTTLNGNSNVHIHSSTETTREATEQALVGAVVTKYDSDSDQTNTTKGWGNFDITSLGYKTTSTDTDNIHTIGMTISDGDSSNDHEFEKVLLGWVKPTDKTPVAQLSFYHADATANSVGVELVHMENLSFFLYYYADTSGTSTTAKLKGRPSLSRDEFMKALNNDSNDKFDIGGMVAGQGPAYAAIPAIDKGDNDLTYKGLMLAGTKVYSDSPNAVGVKTHMGDAELVLKFKTEGTAVDKLTATFSNIQIIDDYLSGKTGGGTIEFDNLFLDDDHAIFNTRYNALGVQDLLSGTGSTNTFSTAGSTAGIGLAGKFYGNTNITSKLDVKADNYKNRDSVGGTFVSRLKGQTKGAMYYGVFGAQATP